jgi:hypothetical protein
LNFVIRSKFEIVIILHDYLAICFQLFLADEFELDLLLEFPDLAGGDNELELVAEGRVSSVELDEVGLVGL